MNRPAGYVLFAGLVASTALKAEPVPVIAGEHEDFTRLVLEMPPDMSWELQGELGEYRVSLLAHDDGFDTSRTFSIIPRDRLASVSSDQSSISLKFNCDCPVEVFEEQGGYLVIDVLDGPPLQDRPNEPLLATDPAVETRRRPEFETTFGYGDLLWSPIRNEQGEEQAAEGSQNTDFDTPAAAESIKEQTEAALSLQVGEAIASGILEGSGSALRLETASEISRDDELIYDSSLPETFDDTAGNVRVSSSNDIPIISSENSAGLFESSCIQREKVDVVSWGSHEPPTLQISKARETLFDDTGSLDDAAAIKLAKLYIFLGFGAEARQTLLLSEVAVEYPELFDLAGIVDEDLLSNPRIVHQFRECEASLALWGVLASGRLADDTSDKTEAIAETFFSLPGHLRALLGPRLSNILIEADQIQVASVVLRNIEQLQGNTDATSFAKAKALKNQGFEKEAKSTLAEVVKGNSLDSPAAVVALAETYLTEGDPVPSDLAGTLEAYVFENRNTAQESRMKAILARAKARSDDFHTAFDLVDSIEADYEMLLTTRSEIFTDLTKAASDVKFMQYFSSDYERIAGFVTPNTARQVASRLLELGFPNMAEDALSVIEGEFNISQHRALSARIELDRDNPQAAISLLPDPQNDEEIEILANALAQMGRLAEARQSFLQIENKEAALEAAWLSGDWQELVSVEEPVYGNAILASSLPDRRVTPSDSILEETTAVLDSNQSFRNAIRELLDGTEVTPPNQSTLE
ncbi:hypothetical protein [Roseobacter sp. S98]|uniref:hypothetical protein n=1 Tax=Roseobacter algicola (ex Choi et al. 2025) (nom. illeg.) TaxID=3092138 RepID=UPI003F51926C